MRIGILGSGLMGGKLGIILARSGHQVVFSYSHSESKLKRLAREAGKNASAGTPAVAAHEADALVLAVHWSRVNDVLRQAGDLSGKIIVSCTLPMNQGDTELVVAHKSSGAEQLARKVRKAHWFRRSTPCQARCYSALSRGVGKHDGDRISCTAETTGRPRR